MQVTYERCGGLDVHKKSVTACVITPEGKETRTYGTMTRNLLEMVDWLQAKGVTHVAMESTGVYWKPIYNLLEETGIQPMVVNARDMKNVPGRKTDVKDAEWIADLLRHGLLRGSFIPSRAQRELRELVRYRRSLIEEQSREVNRIQKVLEGANIKLGDVAADVLGKSGREILECLVQGETNPEKLADLARGRLKKKREELAEALRGVMGPHQRMMLASQLRHIDFLDQEIARLDKEIEERMRPFAEALERVDEIHGLGRRNAEEILAETGVDMSRFPSEAHIASWASICPGNNESAGKRLSGKTRKGNPHLRAALVRAARAAARTKGTYLSALYHRLAARRGGNRAAVAVGHAILVIIYHMLKKGTPYEDLGPDYFDKLNERAAVSRAVARLEALGYKVTLAKQDETAA
ncbi:MAG: IS110 family transposase [Desulfofundulus sp.]